MNELEMTDLLERVGSGLEPDVARLVAGGAARGRTRQRRRRAGVAAGWLAVVAVLLAATALATAGDTEPPVANDSTATPPVPADSEPRTPIARDDVPAAFASLFGGSVSAALAGEGAVTDFRWESYQVRVVIASAGLPGLDPAARCTADSGQPNCVVLANGTAVALLSKLDEPRAPARGGAEGYTPDGFDVSIRVGDASGSKSGPIQSRRDELDLVAAVASDIWFQ
jgi:hypothetical protein